MTSDHSSSKIVSFIFYSFFIFTLAPLFIGLAIPAIYAPEDVGGHDIQLLEKIPYRTILLCSTGLMVSALTILIFILLSKTPHLQKLYTFLLLPLCLIGESAQIVMYREFGQEINFQLLDLLHADLPTLWKYACHEYHLDIYILLTILASAIITHAIYSSLKNKFTRSVKLTSWTFGSVCILFWTLGIALRGDISRRPYFHPEKTSRSPLFQLAQLGFGFTQIKETGYVQILSKTQEITTPIEDEIRKRLQEPPEIFISQTTSPPHWLKEKPSHVFLFLLESFGSNLLDDPDLRCLAPNLNFFNKDGISTPTFFATGHCTIEAIHSILSGVAPIDQYPTRQYPTPKTLARFKLNTLPQIMKKSGYTPIFYAGSHRKFRLKGDVCEAYGFNKFVGCPDVATEIKSNEWGVNDEDFFSWAQNQTSDLTTPHFITFLNVSNHIPFDAPLDKIKIPSIPAAAFSEFLGATPNEKKLYAKHVYYADHQLGVMARFLKKKYPQSLFIFVGDHNSRNISHPHSDRVPFILWNPSILDRPNTNLWFGSHMDIEATLANLLLPNQSQISTLGRPVWSQMDSRISLTNRHWVTRFGPIKKTTPYHGDNKSIFENTPHLPPEQFNNLILKGSAIEALSWGYLYSKPLNR